MRTVEDDTMSLAAAVAFRNKVDSGLEDFPWVKRRIAEMVEEGYWNYAQIAELAKCRPSVVSNVARGCKAPAQRAQGGVLRRSVLDIALELRGASLRGDEHSPELLRAAVETGTSTKLIARLTLISLGKVLYQQRKVKDATGDSDRDADSIAA